MVGPRPKIRAVRASIAGDLGIEIGRHELPSGTMAGLAFAVDNLHGPADGPPHLEVSCQRGESRKVLKLAPGDSISGASLSFPGPETLYLSVDPVTVGYSGCLLVASVITEPEGRSGEFALGHVVRIPRLEKFTLTSEKVGDSRYAGILQRSDLDVIEKAGWDAADGVEVDSIPTPVPGAPLRQTLRIVLPWPAPSPHAPLYIRLRPGSSTGVRHRSPI